MSREPPAPSASPQAADWLAGVAVVVIAPLLGELPIWISAAYLAAVGWHYLHTRFGWPQLRRWLRWVLALAAVAAVLRYYGTLLGREPGISLLVLLTGLKLLELRSLRDAVLAALLLLLVLLGGFLYSSSLVLGAYTLVAVVAVTAALMRLQHPGLSLRAIARSSAVIVLQALPLMVVAYLLFPRLPDAFWAFQVSDSGGTSGLSDRMEPGSVSALTLSDEVAFRAYFDGPPPPNRDLYWRVRVLWDSDGRTWTEGPPLAERATLRRLGELRSYRVMPEPSKRPWVPALDVPVSAPAELRRRAGFVYEARRAQREHRSYELVSATRYRTGALDPEERRRALALAHPPSARLQALVDSWRTERAADADVVRAALAHFNREPFVYTLNPPLLGRNPVDEFLFETRRGFCEHYAAAFVTLMRAAGIPARVVIGYQGGVYNDAGDYLMVRQSDAHAWAEVWLAERGWTRVDPTAAIAPSRIEYGIDGVRRLSSQGLPLNAAADAVLRAIELPWLDRAWFRTRLAWDYLNFSWYRWVSNYTLERQREFLELIGLTEYSVPAMFAILLQLLFLYALLQLRRRRSRDAVQDLYERYCRKLARAGIARAAAEGPLALAERARARRPDLAPAIDRITAHYVALRYGRPGRGELRALARLVRRFRPMSPRRRLVPRS
ncbi:MAG TPA: DUF3488 and transglutaminase-like domain-containing protein [Burkholderiales bacterium]